MVRYSALLTSHLRQASEVICDLQCWKKTHTSWIVHSEFSQIGAWFHICRSYTGSNRGYQVVHGRLLFLTLAYWVRFTGALACRFMYRREGVRIQTRSFLSREGGGPTVRSAL